MAVNKNALSKRHIHESNLIEGYDDPEIDRQSYKAWEWLRDIKVMNHHTICELQRRLTAHQAELDDRWRGTYRDRSGIEVTIAGRPGVPSTLVRAAMDEWLYNIFPLASPKDSHIAFEKIHPFIDGNGRVGRMLYWWKQKQLGKPLTLFTSRRRARYYRWFE